MKCLNLWSRLRFDHSKYEYFSKIENGYLNWVLENKILAFSSPVSGLKHHPGHSLDPEAYISLFKEWNIKLIIRLNKKLYD